MPTNPHPLDAAARDELARIVEEVRAARDAKPFDPQRWFAACREYDEQFDADSGGHETVLALLAAVERGEADTARLSWLEAMLRPLPWGGVYALVESDGESQFRFTMQPSSGDAPFLNETGTTLRDAIDAAMNHKDEEPDAR